MRIACIFFHLFFVSFSVVAQIKVSIIGDNVQSLRSSEESYLTQLKPLLGHRYNLEFFGSNETAVSRKSKMDCFKSQFFIQALNSRADIFLIDLGANDTKPENRPFLENFEADYTNLIKSIQSAKINARIILLTPRVTFRSDINEISDQLVVSRIIPLIQKIAFEQHLEIIDLHPLFLDKPECLINGVNLNSQGARIIASRLAEFICQKRDVNYDIFQKVDSIKNINSFFGYDCADFIFKGNDCKVVKPKWAAPHHPWVWRARFWGHEPQTDIALLERGFHVVYCDVVELLGNDEAVRRWSNFYDFLNGAGLSKKAVMEGMSRGGVYVYNWAALNPKKVACVYVDNPVLDLRSWPAGLGNGTKFKAETEKLKKDYGLLDNDQIRNLHNSPVDKISQIVKGGYPMLHLLADNDKVVLPEENTLLFADKIRAAGGNITIIHKPGFGHHPHSFPNPAKIVSFILANSKL